MLTANGRMMAFSAELGAILESQKEGCGISASSVSSAIFTQGVITRRIYNESKSKNETDSVNERVKCDSFDKAISSESLYLSETKRFNSDGPSFDSMVSTA